MNVFVIYYIDILSIFAAQIRRYMTKDTAILLVNMGSPKTEKEVKTFLNNMFTDKAIMPLPYLGRLIVSRLISSIRYKSSWKKYLLIQGSPLMEDTEACGLALAKASGRSVFTAYSYVPPYIKERMQEIQAGGFTHLHVITMYPQNSFTTTSSVHNEVMAAQKTLQFKDISFGPAYATHDSFIAYWAHLVQAHMKAHDISKPLLICSAHSIPYSRVQQGDDYPHAVENMSKKLAAQLQLDYRVAYQSQVGHQKWLEPDIEIFTEQMISEGHKEIVILPISFTTECLETEYDLSIRIANRYKDDSRLTHISRVYLPKAHPLFIETLKTGIDDK